MIRYGLNVTVLLLLCIIGFVVFIIRNQRALVVMFINF